MDKNIQSLFALNIVCAAAFYSGKQKQRHRQHAGTGSQWEVLACLHLKSPDKLSNNSEQSCVLVVTCLFTHIMLFSH